MEEVITITDIDLLCELRFNYISTEIDVSNSDRLTLLPQLRRYFEEHLLDHSFTAYGYLFNGKIISTAFLTVDHRPPGFNNLNGSYGTIMNVFTFPEYQKRGYASVVLKHLIEDAKMEQITVLDLYATDKGRSLYEKMGFKVIDYTAMRLIL